MALASFINIMGCKWHCLPSIFNFQKSNSKIPMFLRLISSTWENYSIRSRLYCFNFSLSHLRVQYLRSQCISETPPTRDISDQDDAAACPRRFEYLSALQLNWRIVEYLQKCSAQKSKPFGCVRLCACSALSARVLTTSVTKGAHRALLRTLLSSSFLLSASSLHPQCPSTLRRVRTVEYGRCCESFHNCLLRKRLCFANP